MENKRYLDKVIGFMVRGTNIDYEKKLLHFRFYNTHTSPHPSTLFFIDSLKYVSKPPPFFRSYSKNTFGLTEDECRYVRKQYVEIINHKIENGE